MVIPATKNSGSTGLARSNESELDDQVMHRGARLMAVGLVLAAFGPYIVGPIRVEQLTVYALAILVLFTFRNLRPWAGSILVAWCCYAFSATIAVIFPYKGTLPWAEGNLLAGYDNILLSLAVMLVVWSLVPQGSARVVLRAVATTAVWAMAINAVLASVSSIAPAVTSPLLKSFWGAGEGSVAENAMRMGRFTGVFNSPAEAGLMYSVAAVLAVWLYSHRLLLMYTSIAVISTGGVLSVSKIFLLIGIPVMVLMVFAVQKGVRRLFVGITLLMLGVVLVSSTFIQNWSGYDYMMRLMDVPMDQSAIEFYTAGRWNEDANMVNVIRTVLSVSPVVGLGAVGVETPYDSQWTEVIIYGGIIGVLSFFVVFFVLIFKFQKICDWKTRYMALSLWVVLFVGSFGGATLTSNRTATIVWVVLALLVSLAARDENKAADLSRRPADKRISNPVPRGRL